MLGFNAMFHLLSLLLFAGIFFYILKLQKRQRLIRRIWFAENERVLVSPQEFIQVFGFCLGLDGDGVNSLTANLSGDKKLLDTRSVRQVYENGTWSIASNRLIIRPNPKKPANPDVAESLKVLRAFLGPTVDIIEPN